MNIRTCSMIVATFTFAAILQHSILIAQVDKKAQVGFRFLENPVSAEVVGRGCVGITTTFTSNAVFWNPALIGWVTPSIDLSLNTTRYIANINYNSAAGLVHLGDFGVFGFSFLMMDYGNFYETYAVDKSVNDLGYVETGIFSPKAFAVGAVFAQKISDRFSYGVHIKYTGQDLGKAWVIKKDSSLGQEAYAKNVFAADVGAFYDFHYHGIRFGATLQNISQEVQYVNEAFPLPFAVSFGLAMNPLTFISDDAEMKAFTLSFESRHPRDYGEKLKFGAEYKFVEFFTARLGYMTNYDERGLTAGAGVQKEISGVPLRVDYAYEPFGIFGGVLYLSLGVSY